MTLDRATVGALSHAELVELVVRQSELIDQLQALIAQVEARVRELEEQRDRDDPTTRMPGLKPAATPQRRKAGPRRRREHGFSRVRGVPTERVEHAAEACPHCATALADGWVAWRKEVLEIPEAPVPVIEHVYLTGQCPNAECRARVTPRPRGRPSYLAQRLPERWAGPPRPLVASRHRSCPTWPTTLVDGVARRYAATLSPDVR
jgi:hypothetical protein